MRQWKKRRKQKVMENLKKSSPWVEYYRMVEVLFKRDPSVKVMFDEDSKKLSVYVRGTAKAEALAQVLPVEKTFGNVTITIAVIPANEKPDLADLIRDAFSGNDVLKLIHTNQGPVLGGLTYVVFEPQIAQYFADNLMDINANCSALYEDIARRVFREDLAGVAFCTGSVSYDLSKPLGEWP